MTPSNDVLRSLLANFPVIELTSDEHRRMFQNIANRLLGAADGLEELKILYRVKGFSDFATGLMWMVDRAEKNPGQSTLGPEDETLLLSSFRRAMGEHVPSVEAGGGAEGGGGEGEKEFGIQVDQFSESVQSGAGGSRMLLEDIITECEAIANRGVSEGFKELTSLLADFLRYIAEGDLLDDVRVINLVSNISSSISQWANAPLKSQAGFLEEALNLLRDFKSHFE